MSRNIIDTLVVGWYSIDLDHVDINKLLLIHWQEESKVVYIIPKKDNTERV